MKYSCTRYLQRIFSACLAIFLLVTLLPFSALAEREHRVLRVAFPSVRGFSETDADGTRHGLIVDYLDEISKYTGWEYEYIDCNPNDMIDDFLNGAYDLMGGTYYSPGFEKYFAYPDYNTGYSTAILLARQDDHSVRSYDVQTLNGKTIGVFERATENIRRLNEFLSFNNLDCTIRSYQYDDLSSDENLYDYLANGEIDLLLGNGSERVEGFRTVVTFDSQPHYIVTNLGNQEVLDGLNMALEKITDSNPKFAEERREANFSDTYTEDIFLDNEERDYIQKKGTVTVAVPKSWHPLFCLDVSGDLHNGIVPDILNDISAFTGLRFEYVFADTYIETIRMVQEGKADMLGFFLGSQSSATPYGLSLSQNYANMNCIVVRNKSVSFPSDNLIGAVLEGRELPSSISSPEIRYFSTISDGLSAVNNGEVDFFYGVSSRLEQEIQRYHFSNIVPVAPVNDNIEVSFAMPKPADVNLLTILNKSINHIPDTKKLEITNRNMVSIGSSQLTIYDLIYANPVVFVTIVATILVIILAVVLVILRMRLHAAAIQTELEKAEAASRAKGEFLSRMSHEIRTPMNAVVGLTDLTSMQEDLPEPVRKNLVKIRSSSRYLLNLINDILDMSRIENGMMTIDHIPFSIGQMLNEIQSMMTAEAERNELTFLVEQKFQDDILIGDATRLKQVIMNLLSNAFKFTPLRGRVLLRVKETEQNDATATFRFQVIDNGMGIPKEDQKRIFDAFEQSGPSSSKSQGTGLGLPISQSIVRLMGGELQLESAPDSGSEFFFTLTFPIGEMPPVQEIPQDKNLLAGVHILLAEDNDLNAEIAIELLEIQGAVVQRAENGRLVVEQFTNNAPGTFQMILMDIQMPEMNGLEAARAIRALDRPDASVIPIIAMTANSFQEDKDAAVEAGMDDFLSKPLDVNLLYEVVGKFTK